MNKPAKPEADDADDLSDLFGPPLTEAEDAAWWERNREVIGQLVEEALAETEPPTPWNPEEIMAEVREQLRKEGH
jgi:hypothetical protein